MKIRKVNNKSSDDMISFPPDTFERPRKDFTCFICKWVLIIVSMYTTGTMLMEIA